MSKQLDRLNYIVLDTDKRPTTTEELEEREMNRRGAPGLYPGKWHPRSDLRAKLSTGYPYFHVASKPVLVFSEYLFHNFSSQATNRRLGGFTLFK